MIITECNDIKEEVLIQLIYDFRMALEFENYELCQKIKDEIDRRFNEHLIDKVLIKAIVEFLNFYTKEDNSPNKEYFNQVFEQYI